MPFIQLTQTNTVTIYVNVDFIISFKSIKDFTEITLNQPNNNSMVTYIKINEPCEWLLTKLSQTI